MNRTAHEQVPTDAELVERARRGLPEAFADLVARYQDRIFNTCYRMCHNRDDALDLTQSTFLKALENLSRFESRSGFYTWLFRIAVNLALSHRRNAARHRTTSLDGPAPGSHAAGLRVAEGAVPERQAEQQDMQDRLEWALRQLEDEFRAAVVLKDIEGMDYATIAEVMDVPVGTVKSRIHRGRLMLRELLAERRPVDRA